MAFLNDALKRMLNGLAYADAGEYLTTSQKTAYLQNSDVNIIKATDPAPVLKDKSIKEAVRRRVAMYMGSELPEAMMNYVIETCSSLDHDLTVLTLETKSVTNALLAPYEAILGEKGIAVEVAKLSGKPVESLAKYLRGHPEVAFMACKDSGYLGRSYLNGTQVKDAMPVPVVVVVTQPAVAGDKSDEQVENLTKTA